MNRPSQKFIFFKENPSPITTRNLKQKECLLNPKSNSQFFLLIAHAVGQGLKNLHSTFGEILPNQVKMITN